MKTGTDTKQSFLWDRKMRIIKPQKKPGGKNMKMRDFMYSGCFDAQEGFAGHEVKCDEDEGEVGCTKGLIWYFMMLQILVLLSNLL